jgi:hypothetical protein
VDDPNDLLIDVFVGVDVGKAEHHAVALDRAGAVLLDRSLPQDEAKLVELIEELKSRGRVLFVVDQPATIGALPLAVARSLGVEVGYLPGLAMRRIADVHAGEAKTDARDAAIIAQAAHDAARVAGVAPRRRGHSRAHDAVRLR